MSTPVQIQDAVKAQIPYPFRAEVATLFADLKSEAPIIRENAIIRGHSVASRLKAIADSQTTPGLYSDAEPSACLKVASDLAKQRIKAEFDAPGESVFRRAFFVDVNVEMFKGRVAVYRIMAVHDVVSLPDDV